MLESVSMVLLEELDQIHFVPSRPMAGNVFGTLFTLTTYGESHGVAIGGVVDGCPAGLDLDLDAVQLALDRRKPGQSAIVTQRKESDKVQFQSGIFEGKTLGTPIGFVIPNEDQKSKDYSHIKDVYRPSHADYTYDAKYGLRDYRGGGRSSARETACRVVAGEIARQILAHAGVEISAYVSRVKGITLEGAYDQLDLAKRWENDIRCPDPSSAERMTDLIKETKKQGNTVGGVITCVAKGVPAGWGEPAFDKLPADLSKAMMSINATKAFSIGSGWEGTYLYGSEHNDLFEQSDGQTTTTTNRSGGTQGGISNGQDIYFDVAFKPVATIMRDQQTVDSDGNEAIAQGKGRHDPCVLPRAVPIVEAMTALVLVDHYLRSRTNQLNHLS